MDRPQGSGWADYRWSPSSEGSLQSHIRVNPWLDSSIVPAFVIEFLLYHELLHHQDVMVLDNAHSYHDRAFREREQLHPNTIEANAFVDTLLDHWRPRPAGSSPMTTQSSVDPRRRGASSPAAARRRSR